MQEKKSDFIAHSVVGDRKGWNQGIRGRRMTAEKNRPETRPATFIF
jgi:hypothetical protein